MLQAKGLAKSPHGDITEQLDNNKCGASVKNLPANAGDVHSIPGSGRSPRAGNGNSLQYSCLENPMDRGVWRATVHGVSRVGHDLVTKRPPMLQWVGSRAWASVVVAPGL